MVPGTSATLSGSVTHRKRQITTLHPRRLFFWPDRTQTDLHTAFDYSCGCIPAFYPGFPTSSTTQIILLPTMSIAAANGQLAGIARSQQLLWPSQLVGSVFGGLLWSRLGIAAAVALRPHHTHDSNHC